VPGQILETLCSRIALTATPVFIACLLRSFQPYSEENALPMTTMGVGEVGAIISIADVAARVCLRLGRFLNEVKDAGETRSSLHKKAAALHDILKVVDAATRKRNVHVHTKPISDDEGGILVMLTAALGRCESTVKKFEEMLGRLGGGGTEPNWLGRAILQLKLDVRGSGIAKIERDIEADIAPLQLLSTCFLP